MTIAAMTSADCQVRLTGALRPDVNRDQAIDAFCGLFKLSRAAGEQAFARAPVVIKKGIDRASAEKIQAALDRIGVLSEVEVLSTAASADAVLVAEPVVAALAPVAETAEAPATRAPVTTADPRGLAFTIEGQPDYAFLTVQLPAGQMLKVEASAMATMDTNLVMKTKLRGGLGRLLTSESIFINEFTAQGGSGEIGIAPATPGDLGHVYLDGDTVFLQNSAFVACAPGVEIETKWQGLMKGFFSGESLFLIKAAGRGDLWFNTYGGLIELDVDGDYVVDTGNIVAFTEGLDYTITKVGGYKSLFFSGEGLVCRFSGTGKVWIQTRAAPAFAAWAEPFRPVKKAD